MDPYTILNVHKEASDIDIKKAYRKLAAEHHPDKGGNEEEFKKINEAYSMIDTEQKRRQHEASKHFGGFEDMFGGFNSVFEGFFGNRSNRKNLKEKTDEEILFNINVSLAHIKQGVNQVFTFSRNKKCNSCDGIGGQNKNMCYQCDGRGTEVMQMGPFMQHITCRVCFGAGHKFEYECQDCHGSGFKQTKESVNISIENK